MREHNYQSVRQKGYILLMTLVMLGMLTILGLTLISSNTNQTRMVAQATDTEISFEKTEGALNHGINSLIKGIYTPANFLANANGLYVLDLNSPPKWTTVNWAGTGVINSFGGSSGTQSSFIIEQLPSVNQLGQNMKRPTDVYRITSRSQGATGNTNIMLQSTVQINN